MEHNYISESHLQFEAIKRHDDELGEYWSSREIAKILQYADYRNFLPVIEKAKKACINSNHVIEDHFVDVHEMVSIGSNANRKIETCYLSRYACYLIIQNADPSKPIVAAGQTYFAVQTRKQELANQDTLEDQRRLALRKEVTEHNKKLVSAAKKVGVETSLDYAIFQDHGYKGLYGGLGSKDIHARKQLKKSQKILDHMGSTELAANLFRATQAEEKLRKENIQGKTQANRIHFDVGQKVRQTIEEIGGTMPENLETAESIKKLEREERRKLDKSD